MSNPSAPNDPEPIPPGTVSDPDAPNPFGPDAPSVRDDDPKEGQGIPEAPQPSIPIEPLEDDEIAPDES